MNLIKMYNITLIKDISPKVSITNSNTEDVLKTIKEKVYAEELVSYRLSYPYAQIYSNKERKYRSKLTIEKEVPQVCFSGVYRKKKRIFGVNFKNSNSRQIHTKFTR